MSLKVQASHSSAQAAGQALCKCSRAIRLQAPRQARRRRRWLLGLLHHIGPALSWRRRGFNRANAFFHAKDLDSRVDSHMLSELLGETPQSIHPRLKCTAQGQQHPTREIDMRVVVRETEFARALKPCYMASRLAPAKNQTNNYSVLFFLPLPLAFAFAFASGLASPSPFWFLLFFGAERYCHSQEHCLDLGNFRFPIFSRNSYKPMVFHGFL